MYEIHFQQQIQTSDPIWEETATRSQIKRTYFGGSYLENEKIIFFWLQRSVSGATPFDIKKSIMEVKTMITSEMTMLETSYRFYKMAGRFPIFVKNTDVDMNNYINNL